MPAVPLTWRVSWLARNAVECRGVNARGPSQPSCWCSWVPRVCAQQRINDTGAQRGADAGAGGIAVTGRERVSRMFERRDHDRVPRYDTYWAETITRWQGEGLQGDLNAALDLLGTDFQRICWCSPRPFPEDFQIISEDKQTVEVRNDFGAIHREWKGRSGTPEHLGFGCDSRQAWEDTTKPMLFSKGPFIDPREVEAGQRRGQRMQTWRYLGGIEAFEFTRQIMGDEITLIAMVTDPEWIVDVVNTHTDLLLAEFDAALASGVEADCLWIYGDMAYNHSTMCSPQMYRDLVWPCHRRLTDWAHAHDMKCMYHTDGDVTGVIDLYIEAGFDCLQPLEAKAGMDLRQLAPKYGDRLAFFGNIDAQALETNDHDLIEQEIRSKLAAGMETKGYIYHSDHSVPHTVSLNTYEFIIKMLDQYGSYDTTAPA